MRRRDELPIGVKDGTSGWRCHRCGEVYMSGRLAGECYESHVLDEALSTYDPEDAKYE